MIRARDTLEVRVARLERELARHPRQPAHGPLSAILDAVADVFGVPVAHILSERRQQPIVQARQVVMHLAVERLSYSLPRVGRLMGRDHTTVLHACRAVAAKRSADPDLDARIDLLTLELDRAERAPSQSERTNP